MCAVYGPNIVSEGVVRQWVRFFKDGRTNIHNESRSGRPSVVNADLIKEIDEKIRLLRNFTISQLSEHLPNISRTVLYETVTGKLGYRKFCARWVPKMLTEIHKTSRMGAALEFLSRYYTNGEDFLNRIVTGGWVAHVNVETKQQSMVNWSSNPAEESPSNFVSEEADGYRLFGCSRNLAYRIHDMWNNKNSEVYCRTWKKLKRAIQNKRRGLLSSGVVLLHDNTHPHTAVRTGEVLRKFK
ncbi:hypothetical protein AVEN_29715-1 [Araneus ventricosus]|uniref:Histone-lysine N-methyltransferase SETMAR n=1 Tax=Araneus ventricosus TaxID=182803 RepID=A0A4Y2NYH4_ARAVE|nr:hypothetical protein AVEN_29715-1 [Araneus ventricosus]